MTFPRSEDILHCLWYIHGWCNYLEFSQQGGHAPVGQQVPQQSSGSSIYYSVQEPSYLKP
jgi:hypothetical protein